MAMTLRLDDADRDALRELAAREGRSMHDVALAAVRDRIAAANTDRDAVLADIVTRRRTMLDELAEL